MDVTHVTQNAARIVTLAAAFSAAIAAVAATAAAAAYESDHPPKKKRRFNRRNRSEGFEFRMMSSTLDNAEYLETFRMNRECMESVMGRVGGLLQVGSDKQRFALSGSGHVITAPQRLCVALRWFGGGQRVDIRRIYGTSILSASQAARFLTTRSARC